MNRSLILIGNEGIIYTNSYLPGVSADIARYKAFFKSDFGGAWEDNEILPINFGWTNSILKTALNYQRIYRNIDYALIVFAGHGYAERNGEVFFELSPGSEISLSTIKSLLPNQKMLMIADSCQGYLEPPLSKTLNESLRSFSEGRIFRRSRAELRDIYNSQIDAMSGSEKAFASAVSPGECANDTSKGGLYSRNLLDCAQTYIQRMPGHGIITIDNINSEARERVVRMSRGQQHPTLTLSKGYTYPPFIVL